MTFSWTQGFCFMALTREFDATAATVGDLNRSSQPHWHFRWADSPRLRLAALLLACAISGPQAGAAESTTEELPTPADDGISTEASDARRAIEAAMARSRESTTPLPAAGKPAPQRAPTDEKNLLPQDLVVAKLSAEVAAKQLEAKRTAQRSPLDAMALLDAAEAEVNARDIPPETRAQLTKRIDRTRRDIEETSGKRRSEMALDQRNA